MRRRPPASAHRAREQAARIGDEVRLAQVSLALSSRQLARRAGVAWSTVQRVRIGDPAVSIETLAAVTGAAALDLVLRVYPGSQPSLRDSGQLKLAEQVVRQLHPAWRPTLECAIGQHGEAIDLVAFGAQEIIAIEIERRLSDLQAQYRRADARRRALAAVHRRAVRLVLVVEDTRRNRAAIAPHQALIGSALTAKSREVLRALRSGEPLGRDGLLWRRR